MWPWHLVRRRDESARCACAERSAAPSEQLGVAARKKRWGNGWRANGTLHLHGLITMVGILLVTREISVLPCSVADAHAATHGALVAAVSSATSTAAVRDAEVAAHGAFGAAEHLAPAAATVSDAQAALECRLGAVERAAALAAAVRGAEPACKR